MAKLTLVIGDKNLSSWSLRPWLLLKALGIPFAERKILLDRARSKKALSSASPSGRVPVLVHGRLKVWDSLAICEYIAEVAPHIGVFPAEQSKRAVARSYMAEMHSGFQSLRSELPMDLKVKMKKQHLSPQTRADISRIAQMWDLALAESKGPYLFGEFGAVDAFFAPVVLRFNSYGVVLKSPRCRKYMARILANRFVREWMRAAQREAPETNRY